MINAVEKIRSFLLIVSALICITPPAGAETEIITRGREMLASLSSVANTDVSVAAIGASDRHCQSLISQSKRTSNASFPRSQIGMSSVSQLNQSPRLCAEWGLTERVQ